MKTNTLSQLFPKTLQFLALAFALGSTHVAAVEIGAPLEQVTIDGELTLDNKKQIQDSQTWSTDQLKGKVHTVQYMAGRSSAKALNQAFIDALKKEKLDRQQYQTTTIINLDDTVFGTTTLVKNRAEASKKEYYWSSIVLDQDGKAREAWDLKEKSSAIMIVDRDGKVLFAKDGKMSDQDIQIALKTIKNAL